MKHVLVIDDDSSMRSLLIDYLSHHAFRVTGISGSQELPRILNTDPVELCILDVNNVAAEGVGNLGELAT